MLIYHDIGSGLTRTSLARRGRGFQFLLVYDPLIASGEIELGSGPLRYGARGAISGTAPSSGDLTLASQPRASGLDSLHVKAS